jgi:hypothetical protein
MSPLKLIQMKKSKIIIIIAAVCLSAFVFTQCTKETAGNGIDAAAPSNGQGGSLARFAVVGNYLYAVDQENLSVFNISNAAAPSLVKTIKVGFEIETIFPFKDKLFIGSTSVVHIFSIDNPESPAKLSEAISSNVIRRCDPVVAKDNVAYATLRTNGPCGGLQSVLAVYDITNVLKPVQRQTVLVGEPYGLGYQNNTLYVCDKQLGLEVYDITSPYSPQRIKSYQDAEWYIDVIPYNDVLICWTSDGVLLYDITNNKNPVKIATIL